MIDFHNNETMWKPPNERWMKCNVDASFNKETRTINKGWCVRDFHGSFIIGGISWDGGLLSTIEVEALAIKEVVQVVIQLRLDFVIFEGDCQTAVQALHAN